MALASSAIANVNPISVFFMPALPPAVRADDCRIFGGRTFVRSLATCIAIHDVGVCIMAALDPDRRGDRAEALVPRSHAVRASRHVAKCERAVCARDREERMRDHADKRDHPRVHVAFQPQDAGIARMKRVDHSAQRLADVEVVTPGRYAVYVVQTIVAVTNLQRLSDLESITRGRYMHPRCTIETGSAGTGVSGKSPTSSTKTLARPPSAAAATPSSRTRSPPFALLHIGSELMRTTSFSGTDPLMRTCPRTEPRATGGAAGSSSRSTALRHEERATTQIAATQTMKKCLMTAQ